MRSFLIGLLIRSLFVAILSTIPYSSLAGTECMDEEIVARVEKSIEIDAPLEEVWDVALDVNSWADYISYIKYASFKGEELKIGSRFTIIIYRKGGVIIAPLTVCEMDKYRTVAWHTINTGGLMKAVRYLSFEEKDGKTVVTSVEEVGGALPRFLARIPGLMGPTFGENLALSHEEWLASIKKRVAESGRPRE